MNSEALSKIQEILRKKNVKPTQKKPQIQEISELSILAEQKNAQNYSIVRCEIITNSSAKLLYSIAVAYKSAPQQVQLGRFNNQILPILEVKINR